jgi:hypothetical protein
VNESVSFGLLVQGVRGRAGSDVTDEEDDCCYRQTVRRETRREMVMTMLENNDGRGSQRVLENVR